MKQEFVQLTNVPEYVAESICTIQLVPGDEDQQCYHGNNKNVHIDVIRANTN